MPTIGCQAMEKLNHRRRLRAYKLAMPLSASQAMLTFSTSFNNKPRWDIKIYGYYLLISLCCVTSTISITNQLSSSLSQWPSSARNQDLKIRNDNINCNRLIAARVIRQVNDATSLSLGGSNDGPQSSSGNSNSNGNTNSNTNVAAAAATAASERDTSNVNSNSNANGASDTVDGDNDSDNAQASLRCDFGAVEQPDLCQFRVVHFGPPQSMVRAPTSQSILTVQSVGHAGLSGSSTSRHTWPAWMLGNGKLALWQGGPLIDATRNDTSGGYIYYETSSTSTWASGSSSAAAAAATGTLGVLATNVNVTSNHNNLNVDREILMYNMIHNLNQHSPHRNQATASVSDATGATYRAVSSHTLNVMQQQQQQQQMFQTMPVTSALVTTNLSAPGPAGMCVSFQYTIQGLSADELQVHVNEHKSGRSRLIWSASESAAGKNWTSGEVLYSVTGTHSLAFVAWPSAQGKGHQQRKFRGYIALDDLEAQRHLESASAGSGGGAGVGGGPCRGHCNFDGDLCGWANADNGAEDDFDWTIGRGSHNLFTGPARDFISSHNSELSTGSYLYVDSAYPRRPGDRAILVSPVFPATTSNDAMCMRVAVHMFGSGIGTLSIKLRQQGADLSADGKPIDVVVWEMSGDAGNSWHQAQTSLSSARLPFQVLIEGVVGDNHLGDIAIDEISFASGACPSSPPVASRNYGDCTFEQSMCYWRNSGSDARLDELDWIRVAQEHSIHGPNVDHTLKQRSGFYLRLENTLKEPKAGTRAFLLSPVFSPYRQQQQQQQQAMGSSGSNSNNELPPVQCLSFYYYMFLKSVSAAGPNLGTLRVYLATNNELIPIWRLTNPISSPSWKQARALLSTAIVDGSPTAPNKYFQIAIEGVWGDAHSGAIAIDDVTIFDGACDIMPAEAKSIAGECTFDTDICTWNNRSLVTAASWTLGGATGAIAIPSDAVHNAPFFQAATSNAGASNNSSSSSLSTSNHQSMLSARDTVSWRMATVDQRPANLQDHTYRAPIGYVFMDALDTGNAHVHTAQLNSAQMSIVDSQAPLSTCLAFWFAAFGRAQLNRLDVYVTQASQQGQQLSPQQPPVGASSSAAPLSSTSSGNAGGGGGGLNQDSASSSSTGASTSNSGAQRLSSANNANNNSEDQTEIPWHQMQGTLVWRLALRNISEINRRKWLYGQVTIRVDSSYIVRFECQASDGGFAIDDVAFYEGACETRPANAKVTNDNNEPISPPKGSPTS